MDIPQVETSHTPTLCVLNVWCAGFNISQMLVAFDGLTKALSDIKAQLIRGELWVSFGSGQTFCATEVCVDVHPVGRWIAEMSVSFKL